MAKQLTIITSTPRKASKVDKLKAMPKISIDRMAGLQDGIIDNLIDRFAAKIDPERFRTQLQDTLDLVSESIRSTTAKPEGFRMKTITVGLAITGEGSVGIATLGAEVSIEIGFEKD